MTNDVIDLFPRYPTQETILPWTTHGVKDSINTQTITLLALVSNPPEGMEGACFQFQKPVEHKEEMEELIDTLRCADIKDVVVRKENGIIINDNPELAIWHDTFIFSDEAFPLVARLLLHVENKKSPSALNKIYEWKQDSLFITQAT